MTHDQRICDRILCVLLADDGWSAKSIAESQLIHETTVLRHIKDYLEDNKLKPENGGSESYLNAIIEAGCFTHVRRKFAEIVKVSPHPLAQYFIDESAKLYRIEAKIKHLTARQRRRVRQKVSKPILNKLKKWLKEHLPKTLPNTIFAKALTHAINRWKSLETYLYDGNVPIDNNPIERNIRPIAVGRKNWLFAGSLAAGQLMTNIMSLLATANGIDPEKWLRETLAVLPTWKNNHLDELLPLKPREETENSRISVPTKTTIVDKNK